MIMKKIIQIILLIFLKMSEKNKKNNTKQSNIKKNKNQNGKGDAPRNISAQFKKNYDQINWGKNK